MRVREIFSSLQGEGVWAGTPMTFVRLSGCNAVDLGLGCVEWCDTKDSWDPEGGEELTPPEVVSRVDLPRVCITGGEPLLQGADVAKLVRLLHDRGVCVHLETNGTLALPQDDPLLGVLPDEGSGGSGRPDWVTVSPKPPGYAVVPELTREVDELKLIADGSLSAERAEVLAAAHPEAVVVLQPVHGASAEILREAVHAVLAHPEWRFSIQLHKVLGIR